MENIFLAYSLKYAEQGLYVFPLKPKSKAPLTSNGFKDATIEPKQIRQWWENTPDANIGIATGSISDLWVLDVDGEYPSEFPPLPKPTVKTMKGYHYYFRYPNNTQIKNRTKLNGAAVDVRGDGGYVVAPPSVHPDGGVYEFVS